MSQLMKKDDRHNKFIHLKMPTNCLTEHLYGHFHLTISENGGFKRRFLRQPCGFTSIFISCFTGIYILQNAGNAITALFPTKPPIQGKEPKLICKCVNHTVSPAFKAHNYRVVISSLSTPYPRPPRARDNYNCSVHSLSLSRTVIRVFLRGRGSAAVTLRAVSAAAALARAFIPYQFDRRKRQDRYDRRSRNDRAVILSQKIQHIKTSRDPSQGRSQSRETARTVMFLPYA